MADPTTVSCNNPEHTYLIKTISEQSTLITQLFAKVQDLERKLEGAQQAALNLPAPPNPTIQVPNFATSGGSYLGQQGYSPQTPSTYETKKAQAQGQPCQFGSKCKREQCWYNHPGSKPVGTSKSSSSNPGQNQSAGNSTKWGKQECRFGINCTREDCRFEHPPEWAPNNTSQEQEPQELQLREDVITEVPTEVPAEASSWGNGQDLSSWGATSTNDWGVPVDNSWGPPAKADNGWGDAPETSWSVHSDNQNRRSTSNSRSASTSMSREGSVSNASTNKSRNRKRGKGGRRADSESIATESTPMSPASLAPTPISAHVEPIPSETPLSPPAQSIDQTSSFNGPDASGEMNAPALELSGPSSSSEPEAPSTPKASWSDEPNIDVVYFPDQPRGLSESLPSVPEGKGMDTEDVKPVDESLDLDQNAPSELYSSWGVSGATASDWGLDPIEISDPTPPVDNKPSGKKTQSKGKGKQNETFSSGTNGRGTPSSLNYAAQSGTRTPSTTEPSEPEPAPEPPQGVPHDQIPDWLLGGDEDAHAVLGIPRAASPKPEGSTAPPRLASTKPAPRPPLSKLAGENFPSLSGILSASKASQSKSEPAKPVFSPRPVGYKITRTSDTSSSAWGKGGKSKDSSSRK